MKLSLIESDSVPPKEYKAAVAVVNYRDSWLLGLAQNTGDDRTNKWVCPGGHIKSGESPENAAKREAREETGVHCTPRGKAFDGGRDGVAFVACRSETKQAFKPNHEMGVIGWFTLKQMESLKLYHNVKAVIAKAKRIL